MAKPESRPSYILQKECATEDVEKSLEVLDKVLSEFEEPDSLPPIIEPESPSQGHQSEDDGYISMNGRRAKFAPTFQPTDETRATTVAPYVMPQPPAPVHPQTVAGNNIISTTASTGTSSLKGKVIGEEELAGKSGTIGTSNGTITVPVADETNDFSETSTTTTTPLPPPPEVAERIIANLFPRVSPPNSLSRSPKKDNEQEEVGSGSQRTRTGTTSSGDYVSAEDGSTTLSGSELQHQRNKEQFDRLFGKVKRDSNLRNSPTRGVSLVTILQDDSSNRRLQQEQIDGGGRRNPKGDTENRLGSQTQMQSTTVPQTGPVQTSLPKTRPNFPSSLGVDRAARFGSLPASNPPKISAKGANICGAGRYSLDEGGQCGGDRSRRRMSSGRGSEDSGHRLESLLEWE